MPLRKLHATEPNWLFTMGRGFFTQQRWYWVHVCGWHVTHLQGAPRNFQSRLPYVMDKQRRA